MVEQQYTDLFEQYRGELDANSAEGLNRHRDAAFDIFRQTGFPSSVQEDYRRSDIVRRFDADLGLNLRNIPVPVNPHEAFRCNVPDISTHTFILINDRYYDSAAPAEGLPDGVFAGSLRQFAEAYPAQFDAHYARIADMAGDGVAAYNTMFARDGFALYVPANVEVEKPLQLINILHGGVDLNVNRRILIIAGENARVKLLVCDHTADDVRFVVTQVTEMFADTSARVDFYELEDNSEKVTRLSSLFCEQRGHSEVVTDSITLHNGYTRNNCRFRLSGKHAATHVGGLAICDKKQHIDSFAFLDHAMPGCTSSELFRNVLKDEATGAFCGKIRVRTDAQKTQAYQTNRNLVLSDTARMFSRPLLEIYADDVKCSHGLTTGQLDEEALFYMRARGISREEARLLLMTAFTRDVVDMIRIPALREQLTTLIDKRFRGELTHCGNSGIYK
ncbi:MAG: Fe-S cluster assembly protein SufD [Proteiniphilum sp.]|jgi:Fe-S cluster assembly protein SufD|nr:Fe-S cluster assembly protein SufD [Proteiniphilum sp.]